MGLGNGRALSFVLGHFGKDRCLNICRRCNTFNRTLMKKTLQFSVGQLNGTREERNKLRQVSSARTFVVASIRIGIFVVVSMQKVFLSSKFIRIFCTYSWERFCDFFAIISHLTSSSLSIFSSFRRSASNSILVIWSEKIILRGAMVHFNTSHLFVGFFQQTEPLFDLFNGLPFFQVCLYGSPSPSGQLI